jgi:chaperonin GroES
MTKMKVKPCGNKIVVKREEAQVTKGGILLPESAQQKPRQGTVLAVGPGMVDQKGHLKPVEVSVGDRVLFSSYAGVEYKGDHDDYLIVGEDDILAVFTDSKGV